jgi:hypothetical protein
MLLNGIMAPAIMAFSNSACPLTGMLDATDDRSCTVPAAVRAQQEPRRDGRAEFSVGAGEKSVTERKPGVEGLASSPLSLSAAVRLLFEPYRLASARSR